MPAKLLLQVHISLDGFIAGPNQSMDWLNMDWDDAMKVFVNDIIMANVKHILLGRKLAQGFIPAWRSRPADGEGVKFMNECPKTVFSNSLMEIEGAEVRGGKLEDAVRRLKEELTEGDLIVYGGVQTVQTLVKAGLVDELFLIVDPVSLGKGERLFTSRANYEVVEAKAFQSGSAILRYRPKLE